MRPRWLTSRTGISTACARLEAAWLRNILIKGLEAGLVLGTALAASIAMAAEPPRVSVELTPDSVAPGETAILRLRVLVPTYMPEPVEFPSLDSANLRVSLPERSTGPATQRIDGETWSGVTRAYRLTPLAPGSFTLGGELRVTYVDPQTSTPLTTPVTVPTATLTATLPEAARGLTPYVAASDITLEQRLEVVRAEPSPKDAEASGDDAAGQNNADDSADDSDNADDSADDSDSAGESPADASSPQRLALAPGDSVTRHVTATLEGGSAVLLPALTDAAALQASPPGLGVYPQTPRIEESQNGGRREESVTYVVEGAVDGSLPAIAIDWFDPTTQGLEHAELPAISLTAKGPAAAADLSPRRLLPWLGAALLLVAALALVTWQRRPLKRRLDTMRRARRRRDDISGRSALSQLRRAVEQRDIGAARQAWQRLQASTASLQPEHRADIDSLLLTLGRLHYGTSSAADPADSAAPAPDAPLRPSHSAAADGSVIDSPAIDSPAIDSPVANSPAIDSPVANSPGIDSPVANSAGIDSPGIDSPAIDSPVANSPGIDSPVANSAGINSAGTDASAATTTATSTRDAGQTIDSVWHSLARRLPNHRSLRTTTTPPTLPALNPHKLGKL
ncbi:hypothetical protein ACUN9Y_00470 [Halomonas sp. V046]|uniref:hypothetical protein n=1 Tax=Halomonas sp. V046 TaxID=3459611 RepID=UPI004043A6E4